MVLIGNTPRSTCILWAHQSVARQPGSKLLEAFRVRAPDSNRWHELGASDVQWLQIFRTLVAWAISPFLIQDEDGQPLSYFALRSRFDKARRLPKVNFQFRDIRVKAATDTGDLAPSQSCLHTKIGK